MSRPAKPRPRRDPSVPELPSALEPAELPDHDLDHEASFDRLEFALDLPGRDAGGVEFAECRFTRADLSDSVLPRLRLRDCDISHSNLANLRAEKGSLLRTRVGLSRLTGLQVPDGALRDVSFTECRMDLTSFRFSTLQHVRFAHCNLTRADFSYGKLGGAEFVDCDLTGAQFSEADLRGTRFRRCELTGIGGVTSFAGAVLSGQDLVALSYALAGALGIVLDDELPEAEPG